MASFPRADALLNAKPFKNVLDVPFHFLVTLVTSTLRSSIAWVYNRKIDMFMLGNEGLKYEAPGQDRTGFLLRTV